MSDKPPFDPNAPFSAPGDKPPFDPNAAFSTTAPEDLPDVGRAPFFADAAEDQISPGLPWANKAADVFSASAEKNIFQPIKHPVDTAMGAARLGAGIGQYAAQGYLGSDFEPDVDALVKDYAKTYGTWEGFRKAVTEDPVRVALDASTLAGGLGALSRVGRRAVGLPTRAPAAPSVGELFDSADGHYSAMHGFGVEVHPQVMDDVATNMTTALKADGFYPRIAPKTFDMIEELRSPDGPAFTTGQIDSIRKGLGKISPAADPSDAAAARQVINEIDNTMAGLQPADVAVNPHFAPRVAQEAALARGDYAAAKRAETVEHAQDMAQLQAASTGSGANIDNATRQKYRTILASKKLQRGFSPEELAQMRDIVTGTTAGNAARLVGKLAPSGIVSASLSGMLGHTIGHAAGVPAFGLAAKKISDAATAGAAARLSETVRLRSPLARAIGARPRLAQPTRPSTIARRLNLMRAANQEGQ